MAGRAVGSSWPLVFLWACAPDTRTFTAGTSERVCQLTGETEWTTGLPTTFKPENRGMDGTDLGYPVEHNGRLALLFGDTRKRPSVVSDESGPADDAVGWITSESPPTHEACTDLVLNAQFPNLLVSPRVLSPGPIKQGLFNVPSGGVSKDGWLYAFFWTDHCNGPQSRCPESESLNSVGRGVLARSHDFGETFHDAVPMPFGFVYSTAVDATTVDTLPPEQRVGTYVFGVPLYRGSVPYLAWAPEGKLLDPHSWKFFVSLRGDGQPKWVTSDSWNNRDPFLFLPGPDLYPAAAADRCVGEFSITWNRALRVWLLLYNCKVGEGLQSIVARTADAPWGPWSEGTVILSPADPGSPCNLLMTRNGCGSQGDYWKPIGDGSHVLGDFYAPFVMERYTRSERTSVRGTRRAAVYWLVSTWNPYQVIVMRTVMEVYTPPTRSIYVGR